MKWTDYRLSKLREMWGKGYPAIEIASMLGVTKNSIIGKANRLNLTPRKRGCSSGTRSATPKYKPKGIPPMQ